ncbi:hypothetical protein [Pedobacter endophyticus]|uniref:Uncharacterized protein n=1 Tax=Pedobacter endophyticus TaxID=2789740 RepID=A0A7S9KYY0_9SPHI|nr:hypothetical protein [Pedobacter endophyticus]QPH39444.1 hypothetical protein IZT61_20770 [Pedobacter endophyticus]
MDNIIIKNIIKDSLLEISFEERYIQLCNRFKDYDNCKNVKNSDLNKVLNEIGFSMESVPKESIFFKEYDYKYFRLRFILPYKHGIIDCSELYWNENNSIRIYGGFRSYIREINPDIKNQIQYLSPISTSERDLKVIVQILIELHVDFLNLFSQKIE